MEEVKAEPAKTLFAPRHTASAASWPATRPLGRSVMSGTSRMGAMTPTMPASKVVISPSRRTTIP
eukprot:803261-Prorocentrum_minimum.AAC.1